LVEPTHTPTHTYTPTDMGVGKGDVLGVKHPEIKDKKFF